MDMLCFLCEVEIEFLRIQISRILVSERLLLVLNLKTMISKARLVEKLGGILLILYLTKIFQFECMTY